MNKERINQLADHLEKNVSEREFDMIEWGITNECGTVACIAGHASALFAPERFRAYAERHINIEAWREMNCPSPSDDARHVLDLDDWEAHALFFPTGDYWIDEGSLNCMPTTKENAIRVLRKLAE